jgi:hypothetical protein
MEDLAGMKADLVGLKVEAKVEAQKSVVTWLDGRLTRVEDAVSDVRESIREIKPSVIFWGAVPSVLVAIAAVWAYFHGMKP